MRPKLRGKEGGMGEGCVVEVITEDFQAEGGNCVGAVGSCHHSGGRKGVVEGGRGVARAAAAAGAALVVCCAALVLLASTAAGQGSSVGGPAELMQGIALTGKNSFLLSVPSGGIGGTKVPSWSQLADGADSNPPVVNVEPGNEGKSAYPPQAVGSEGAAGGNGVAAAISQPASDETPSEGSTSSDVRLSRSSSSSSSSSSSKTTTTTSSSSDEVSDGTYNSFLNALVPASDSGSPSDSNPPPLADDSGASSRGGDGGGNGGGEGGGEDGGDGGRVNRREEGVEHRSATTVVHRLSREFEERFHESRGAYDFCVREKLTQEELAECIKHMLMKSRPGYKPSDDQALLDRVSVLRLQIREEESQSARALRQAHDKVEELKTRLLTAVPYSKFKELRTEYETKLRALERLVVRFTRDMASENEAARSEGTYSGTANEVARALGVRIRRSESDEQVRALWRLLAKRIRDKGLERGGRGGDGGRRKGEEEGCCKSIHKAIPKLMPFFERRNYIQRVRGRGADPLDYVRGSDDGGYLTGGDGGTKRSSSRATVGVHKLSGEFDQREERVAAAPAPVPVQERAVATAPQLHAVDSAQVTQSASQQTQAALSAAGSKVEVHTMPSLPGLPSLHLPKSMQRS